MTFQMATDGRTVTHISKRKTPVYGRDRKGVQAYDLLFQMTDPMQKEMTSPRVEKPRVLIETFRIVGEDLMTAQDNALYEFLLANARERGIEKDTHFVSVEAMRKYLGIDHNGRVAESLERITRTVVRYDFRDEETRTYGAMPMILAEITEDLRSGGSTLTYAIPSPIRHVVLAAKQYAMLEINVFPKFNSRYSSRLYQRLALRAGMDEELRKPWEISPLKLAIELGFPLDKDGTVHMTSLMRRCVEPAVSEIQQHVRRFKVSMKTVAEKKKGRGRPKIESIVFKVTTAEKIPVEHQAARLTPSGLRLARMHDDVHEHDELPGTLAIGKAITMTGLDEFTLINGWKAMLDRAKANPNAEAVEGVQGGFFLYVLNREGVAPAFYLWAEAAKKAGTIDIMRKLPAVAKTPQIEDSAPKAPITAPPAVIEKGLLEGVKEIVVPIDEIADREKVAAKIRSTIQLGDDPVTVSIRYYEGEGFHTEKVAELWLEEEGFQMLKDRTERDLMSDLEMVR